MTRIDFIGILIFIVLSGKAMAQQERVRFSGVVLNSETTDPVPGVNCRMGNRVSTTDGAGRFALNTQPGDTIFFTHIGMLPYQVVVPDTWAGEEYILAVFMSSDTLLLPEVVVVQRFAQRSRQYRMNARNNMAGVRQEAFSPALPMTQQQNQQRILNEFAASTNKGHVDVKLGVGLESYRIWQDMRKTGKLREETPVLLNREEIDLVKMLFSLDRKK